LKKVYKRHLLYRRFKELCRYSFKRQIITNLKSIEDFLPSECKTHKSFLVSLRHITKPILCVYINGHSIPIGILTKKELLKLFNSYKRIIFFFIIVVKFLLILKFKQIENE
jgi:hypothetical protein